MLLYDCQAANKVAENMFRIIIINYIQIF